MPNKGFDAYYLVLLLQYILACITAGALRSVHTWRQVAATRCSDTSQRQIASCVLENFCENLCLRNIILLLQQVAKNQIRQNLCDLLLRQNSVAETKIFTKSFLYTRGDLSLRRVAVTYCCNQSTNLYTWSDLSPRLVAATCRLVCTDVYEPSEANAAFCTKRKTSAKRETRGEEA